MSFNGFPREAIEFFEGLAHDNSKSYWQAHKSTYDRAVKGAMVDLLAELREFGQFHVFRAYNDVRFAKGRPPYKTQIGAVGETAGGSTLYVQFAADGLMAGTGYHHMASDQLERFRTAVDDEHRGAEIEALAASTERAGYTLGAMETLKTAPRGYPRDHPRIELLRRKGLIATRRFPVAKWLHTKAVTEKVSAAWTDAEPLTTWLDTHVGPSTLPPPDFDR